LLDDYDNNDEATTTITNGRIIDPTIQYEFDIAIRKMKDKKFVTKLKLSNNDKLLLYGLYKQVVVGDAPSEMLSTNGNKKWNIIEENAKYQAWNKNRGMSTEAAAFHYITAIEHFESITADWERCDSDSDDDEDDNDGEKDPMGPGAVSRPVMKEFENNDTFDDDDNNGCKTIESQFFRAASNDDIETIRKLLSTTSDINDNNESSTTTIIDINYRDPMGQTALHIAADKGCFNIIQLLIQEYGADVNATDDDGISVLQTAVIAGHVTICQWLLENTNANPDQPDTDGDTPRTSAEDNDTIKELFNKFPPK
jgi:acyl-CoA-binding protein